jgi:hypothetical protein
MLKVVCVALTLALPASFAYSVYAQPAQTTKKPPPKKQKQAAPAPAEKEKSMTCKLYGRGC